MASNALPFRAPSIATIHCRRRIRTNPPPMSDRTAHPRPALRTFVRGGSLELQRPTRNVNEPVFRARDPSSTPQHRHRPDISTRPPTIAQSRNSSRKIEHVVDRVLKNAQQHSLDCGDDTEHPNAIARAQLRPGSASVTPWRARSTDAPDLAGRAFALPGAIVPESPVLRDVRARSGIRFGKKLRNGATLSRW